MVKEEGKTIGDARSVRFSEAQELGASGLVDGVVDEMMGLQTAAGNGRGVGAFESQGRGLDKEVTVSGDLGEVGRVDCVGGKAIAGTIEFFGGEVGFEFVGEGGELIDGAVHEDELFTTFARALGGESLTSATAGTDDHDAKVADID